MAQAYARLQLLAAYSVEVDRLRPEDCWVAWGPAFAGDNAKPLGPHEQKSQALILDQSMQILVATRLERNLDVASPFQHRVEFIQSIAALCAMYPDEVRRRVQSANKEPYKILWSPRGLND